MKKMMMILALLFAMVGSSFGNGWLFQKNSNYPNVAGEYNTGTRILFIQPTPSGISLFCEDGNSYAFSETSDPAGSGLTKAQMLACFLAAKASGSKVNFLGTQTGTHSYSCISFLICE